MLVSKKGMSALQIMRYMGFGSYKTAWEMCHKVRVALMQDIEKLGGIVEVDETFVGGLAKNKHKDKRGGGEGTGGIGSGKTAVVGAVSRKGNVIARVINNLKASTLEAFVREAVSDKVSLLCTDQWVGYKHLGKEFPPCDRRSCQRAIRDRRCAHSDNRRFLVDFQARRSRHVP
jgi:IS1 family transposase